MKNYWFLGLLLLCSLRSFGQAPEVQVGQVAPAFTVQNDAGTVRSADLKGKIVLINFFATWCGPCMQELPHVQELQQRYHNNSKFALLVIGREHSQAEITAFKTQKKFDLPFYPDEKRTVYSLFASEYIPRNYLLDAEGRVVYTSVGFSQVEFDKMAGKIAELLQAAR
ncbi:hypothetical protein GCM10027594_27090 [Hymenobacter agri]